MLYANFMLALFGMYLLLYQAFQVAAPVMPCRLCCYPVIPSQANQFKITKVIPRGVACRLERHWEVYFDERCRIAWAEQYVGRRSQGTFYYYYDLDGRVLRKLLVNPQGRIIARMENRNRFKY